MKKCQSCGHDNTDIMNYCLECGNALLSEPQMVVPLDSLSGQEPANQTEQITEVYEKETVVGNRFAVQQSIPTFQQQQTPPKKSNAKLYLAIGGGLFAIFALFGVAVIGIAFVAIQNQEPTPKKRPIVSKTPISKDYPTPYPDNSPDVEKTPIVRNTPDTTNDTITFPTPTTATKRGKYTVRTVSGWQLSEIKTIQSQNFRVQASGRIKLDGIKKRVGIKGIKGYQNRRIIKQYKTGALLMRTHFPDGSHSNIQPVGNGEFWVNSPDEVGKMEFLINDNSAEENSGKFNITVIDLGVGEQGNQ